MSINQEKQGASDIAKNLEEIKKIQEKSARSGQQKLVIAIASLIVSVIGIITSINFWLGPWVTLALFLVIAVLLLIFLLSQSSSNIGAKSLRHRRQEGLVVLSEMKGRIEAMLQIASPSDIPSIIDDYYNGLRVLCTLIQENGVSIFDNTLWTYWQIEQAPRSATPQN